MEAASPTDAVNNTFRPLPDSHCTSPWQIDTSGDRCKCVVSAPCRFNAEIFETVMLNLIKNPNVTSSHLFRADIFYDSLNDVHYDPSSERLSSYLSHLKQEYRPIRFRLHGFDLQRTIVRQLVPRNPQLHAALIQTCHILQKERRIDTDDALETIIVYLPHASSAEDIPYYHPPVEAVLFQHSWRHGGKMLETGLLSLHLSPFPSPNTTEAVWNKRTDRTALKLLHTIWKHGQGQLTGYSKRVQHDVVIPQKRVQDTYTALKAKYAKPLLANWSEKTDPTKHVFEDLGIAAFLMELWKDMYGSSNGEGGFPGFVDIGCGNGVLVGILKSEGYEGWGFDARKRKSWEVYSHDVQNSLREMILVPSIFRSGEKCEDGGNGAVSKPSAPLHPSKIHNGIFQKGTFIISNHADELTTWTPLLAYMSDCPFICIPCCSHNLSGARFRAPINPTSSKLDAKSEDGTSSNGLLGQVTTPSASKYLPTTEPANPRTGSLATDKAKSKQPSAYASLCSYVTYLTNEIGFVAEKEVLRIPSTRNEAIIGRARRDDRTQGGDMAEKQELVRRIVERELRQDVETVSSTWRERAHGLVTKAMNPGH